MAIKSPPKNASHLNNIDDPINHKIPENIGCPPTYPQNQQKRPQTQTNKEDIKTI